MRIWNGPLAGALPVLASASVWAAVAADGDQGRARATRDAIVTYRRPPPDFGAPSDGTWHKHGDAVRIESSARNLPGVRVESYTQPGQAMGFTLVRAVGGRWERLNLEEDALAALPVMASRTFTGAVEQHLGESCRVWQVAHHLGKGDDFVQSGCITATGIELWWRQANIGIIIARSIRYQPVPAADVVPPLAALDIRDWAPMTAGGDHRHDYRLSLRAEGAAAGETVTTRSGRWTASRTISDAGGTRFSLSSATIGMDVSIDAKGVRRLSIRRLPPHVEKPIPDIYVRVPKPDETRFGERCQWWDTARGITDITATACITADGVALAAIATSWRNPTTTTATAFRRAPQPLSAVLPDPRTLSPAFWAFPPQSE